MNNLICLRHVVILVLLIGFFAPCESNCQQNNSVIIDSLNQIANSDTVEIEQKTVIYNQLAKYYLDINLDSVSSIALKVIAYSKAEDFKKGIAVGTLRLAQVEETKGNTDKALELFIQTISLYGDLEKGTDYLQAVNSIGTIYEIRHDYDKALEYFLSGLYESDLQGFITGKAFFNNNISIIYSVIESNELALEYAIKASKLFKELGHTNYYANSLLNIGHYYKDLGKSDSAKYYYQQAEILQLENSNYYGLTILYGNLGNISLSEDNVDKAFYFFKKALSNAYSIDSLDPNKYYKLSNAQINIGKTYLLQHDYPNAKINLIQGFENAKRIKSSYLQKEGSKGLLDYYMGLNQKDSAALYLDIFLTFNDSLQAEKYNERIDKLNFEFQLQKERELSEKEKELVVLEKNRQELIYLSLLGILFLIVTVGIFIWYFQKLKLQKSELVQENLRLENENYLVSLDKKNKELMTTVLNLLERNEFISKISEQLQNMELKDKSDNSTNIESIIKSIDKDSVNKLWKEFEIRYMEVHKDFHQKLTSSFLDLTANERRLCAFIVLNLSTKDISSITYQSAHSIKIARYRLRKKLGLDKNENLTAFLHNL